MQPSPFWVRSSLQRCSWLCWIIKRCQNQLWWIALGSQIINNWETGAAFDHPDQILASRGWMFVPNTINIVKCLSILARSSGQQSIELNHLNTTHMCCPHVLCTWIGTFSGAASKSRVKHLTCFCLFHETHDCRINQRGPSLYHRCFASAQEIKRKQKS